MPTRYLVAIIVFFICNCCYAQTSVYELNYSFNVKGVTEQYQAFMVRNGDGTGFMRVRFTDEQTNTPVVIDMGIQEHYMGDENELDNKNTDSSILVFEGYDPQVIVGNANNAYDPDMFWFYKNAQTGYFEPEAVVSIDDDNKEVVGELQMRLLNEKDLTKELMAQYFTPEENIYTNVVEEANTRIPVAEKNTRLFLVVVANTEDITIGTTCVVDKDATYKTFSQLAEFMQIQFVPKIIYGKEFSKVNVDNAINAIHPGPTDIVVFYYSGHGFNSNQEKTRYPYLDLRDKTFQNFGGAYTLNIEDIYKRIKSKGARLNLVVSDCCNADPSAASIVTSDFASTRNSSIGWNMENCRALFMNSKPTSILMTAAAKGELSAGNGTGGIFTYNFRESLEKIIGPFSTNVSWPTLLNTAQKQTVEKAKRTWCKQPDNSKKVCVQNPTFVVD